LIDSVQKLLECLFRVNANSKYFQDIQFLGKENSLF